MARIFRIVAHMPKKKSRYQVRRRTAGAGMTAACGGSGVDAMNSQLVRDPRESFNSRVHIKSLSKKNLTPAPQKERTKTPYSSTPRTFVCPRVASTFSDGT